MDARDKHGQDVVHVATPLSAVMAGRVRRVPATQGHVSTIIRIERALQRAGVRFLATEEGGYGVLLGKPQRSKR